MNYDRVILELIERVSSLEQEVINLKDMQNVKMDLENAIPDVSTRDTTKYIMGGRKFSKNRLVHAIVKRYMDLNPYTPAAQLIYTFDKSLQGSLGVVRTVEEVKRLYPDCEKRFFMKANEIITTATEPCVVCNQWGIANIGNMVSRAQEIGMQVSVVRQENKG